MKNILLYLLLNFNFCIITIIQKHQIIKFSLYLQIWIVLIKANLVFIIVKKIAYLYWKRSTHVPVNSLY